MILEQIYTDIPEEQRHIASFSIGRGLPFLRENRRETPQGPDVSLRLLPPFQSYDGSDFYPFPMDLV
jgi:hypothetical protein